MERTFPIGAEPRADGGVHFRVWAPESRAVSVEFFSDGGPGRAIPLEAEENGYFSGLVKPARPGWLYKFRLDRGSYPDPASRFQPEGPHGPSQVVDPSRFPWTDHQWRGLPKEDLVLYEMHLGTFTREGTWRAARNELPELKRIGITALEIMPVAEFPGRFGWGYDGVDLFAPTRLYGTPDDARAFVDRAHELGLMVILDVVYNHLGPDGNYLMHFSKDYFTDNYSCEWGEAINFDGDNSGPVREFFVSNARYWIREFHFDGLRLDATQQIFDGSKNHILGELTAAARAAAGPRTVYIVAENETQQAKLVRSSDRGGYGLDALWNDDFHHAAFVAATGKTEAYYSDYRGAPQEFISAVKHGFLFQGQWHRWQQKRRGSPAFDLSPKHFVIFLQNHDQIANFARGLRLHQMTSPGTLKALTALLLLAPGIPLLFQGQEFAASAPFLFFADHHPDLNRLVSQGRWNFLSQFRTIAHAKREDIFAEPGDRATFERCKLDFSERERNAPLYHLHRDLLALRQSDPALRDPARIDGAALSGEAFLLRFFSRAGSDRLLLINLGPDLNFNPAPEPLLAPLEDRGWRVLWSSESPCYGGCGAAPLETKANWMLPARSAVLMEPDENNELPEVKLGQND